MSKELTIEFAANARKVLFALYDEAKCDDFYFEDMDGEGYSASLTREQLTERCGITRRELATVIRSLHSRGLVGNRDFWLGSQDVAIYGNYVLTPRTCVCYHYGHGSKAKKFTRSLTF